MGRAGDVPREASWSTRHWIALAVFVALVITDVAFIVADVTADPSAPYPDALSITEEQSLPALLMCAELLASTAVMLWLGARAAVYRLWALVLMYVLLDDALMLHERVAGKLGQWLPFDHWVSVPVAEWALLEFVYFVVVGIAMLAAAAWSWRRYPHPPARRVSMQLLGLLALLAGFAALGDFLGHLIAGRSHAGELAEEAGEMLLGTAIVACVTWQALTEPAVSTRRARLAGVTLGGTMANLRRRHGGDGAPNEGTRHRLDRDSDAAL